VADQLDLGLEPEAAGLRKQWDCVLTGLSKIAPRPAYEGFLKGLEALHRENGRLVIGAPSNLIKRFVEEKYLPLVGDSVAEVFGARLELQLQVGTNGHARPAAPGAAPRSLSVDPTPPGCLPLNDRYTFESFVVGPSNRLAHAGALAVAERPGSLYNPLFIYGGVGVGKTHLLQAIGHRLRALQPGKRVFAMSGETFTIQFLNSLQQRRMDEFRKCYRGADILLLDDIQFIARKDVTQEEFFHTFNELHQTGRQVVIVSDRSPRELQTTSDRLRSRFEAGLVADIALPDLEMRVAILRQKIAQERVHLPFEVVETMAELVKGNVRTLEGALVRLLATASVQQAAITPEFVVDTLGHYYRNRADGRPVQFEEIQQRVCQTFSVNVTQLQGKRRERNIVLARQVAMHLTRELTNASLPEIGRLFGGKDHTTVIHACTKVRALLKTDAEFKRLCDDLVDSLTSPQACG
jgi:chromosomal replication initiator protein